jgi:hypothetical protein
VWLGGRSFDVWGSHLPASDFVWLALAAGVVSMWRVRAAPIAGAGPRAGE